MAKQTLRIDFTQIGKNYGCLVETLCLIRGAYIADSLYRDDAGFIIQVNKANRLLALSTVNQTRLLGDEVAIQALCVGSHFAAAGKEQVKVKNFQELDMLENAVRGSLYDWEGEDLKVNCSHDFSRDGVFFRGEVELLINEEFKINISFDLGEEGDIVKTFNFNGLTAVDVVTRVVPLSANHSAIVITTYAGGKSAENAFCC